MIDLGDTMKDEINWKEVYAEEPWEKFRIKYNVKRCMNEYMPMMLKIIALFKPHTYMELGLRHGYTFNHVTALGMCKKYVGVELDPKNLKGVKNRPGVELYNTSTDEFAMLWSEPIDMLFIDADHSFEQSKRDFDNFSKFMSPCGIICMHDTYPSNRPTYSGAWKTARAIHLWPEYKDWEIFTFPGVWAGLSLVRKAEKHLHYADLDIEASGFNNVFEQSVKDFSKLIDDKLEKYGKQD